MSQLKFGIELEFHIKSYGIRSILLNNLRKHFPRQFVSSFNNTNIWAVGTDATADFGNFIGLELRTGIFTERVPLNFFEILKYIKRNYECGVTKESGIHIHFSGISLKNRQLYSLENLLLRRNFAGKSRHKYCMMDTGKYTSIRQIEGDHYECRLFNSTLNLRAINAYFTSLVRAIDEVKDD